MAAVLAYLGFKILRVEPEARADVGAPGAATS